MKDFKNGISIYLKGNKNILIGFSILCVVFHVLNFILFGDSTDAPVDFIFAIFYIGIVPGIVALLTFNKVNITDYFSTQIFNYIPIILNVLIPIIISIIFTVVYDIVQFQLGLWWSLSLMHFLSIPGTVLGIILVLELKYIREFRLTHVAIIIIYLVTFFLLLDYSSDLDRMYLTGLYTGIFYGLYLFVLPFTYLILRYRKEFN